MTSYNNPVTPMSYTNKDFQTIYPELLELAKSLASNWDPTISNESDPGVVLLKLNAIVADKNNYNIDKNVLENYPETYTQDMSARSQYRQLGYKMPWYIAATVPVTFKYIDSDDSLGDSTVTIPKYSSVADVSGQYVYTILQDVVFDPSTSLVQSADAIQGSKVSLTVNGQDRITLAQLDSNNRVFIDDYNIAQNGIFVKNYDSSTEYFWDQVDNVELEYSNSTIFEFDIDPLSNTPYIQFAQDIRNTIGSGLSISYIVTDGQNGNIPVNTLSKFEDTVTGRKFVRETGAEESITLNDDNVKIANMSSSSIGKDPESVKDAYHSFKRTVHTFKTLVTLRDYINALYNSNLLSNCIVSDRMTDIDSHYTVVEKDSKTLTGIVDKVTYETESYWMPEGEDGNIEYVEKTRYIPSMSAFDLRIYAFQYVGAISDNDGFDKTFNLDVSDRLTQTIKAYLQDEKCVQHDFVDLPIDRISIIQNVYPLSMKIVPTRKVNNVEINSIISNIQNALRQTLNSREMTFGQAVDYEQVLNTITNSDNRIKLIILDDFNYISCAMYIHEDVVDNKSSRTVKMIPVSDFTNLKWVIPFDSEPGGISTAVINIVKNNLSNPGQYLFFNRSDNNFYQYKGNEALLYSDRLIEFRKEIISKNILAGVTPLFSPVTDFTSNITMAIDEFSGEYNNISSNLELDVASNVPYSMRGNESIRFVGPSFINDQTYASYTKYILHINNGDTLPPQDEGFAVGIEANATYQLKDGDWLLLLLRGSGDDDTPYKCYAYGKGTVVRPSFSLKRGAAVKKKDETWEVLDDNSVCTEITGVTSVNSLGTSPHISEVTTDSDYFVYVNNLFGDFSTSGDRKIEVLKMNSATLDKLNNKYYYVVTSNQKDNKYFMTLSKDSTPGDGFIRYSRILQNGEYFIYTNNERTLYEILGEGTLVEWRILTQDLNSSQIESLPESKELANEAVSSTDIALNGLEEFLPYCNVISNNEVCVLTEQQIYSFVKGDIITPISKDDNSAHFEVSNIAKLVGRWDIMYQTASESGKLPIFELSDSYYNWRVQSFLNLIMDKDVPMVIQPKIDEGGVMSTQSVYGYKVDSTEHTSLTSPVTEENQIYIKSVASLNTTGGQDVDISYINLVGNRTPDRLYAYTISSADGVKVLAASDNLEISVVNGQEVELPISLEPGKNYLLPIQFLTRGVNLIVKFQADNNIESLSCLCGNENTDIGMHYYMLNENQLDGTLIFSTDADTTETFVIHPLFKYLPRTEYFEEYGLDEEDILKHIQELDRDNEFKYDNIPDESVVIEDPLKPSSFFDSNNVYNKVTIAKAQLGKEASYIMINNR